MADKDRNKGNGASREEDQLEVAEGEPGEPGGARGGLEAPSVENLEEALKEADGEIASLREQALRAQAELENFRKRAQRDLETGLKFALERFLLELLPVIDSLEMGLVAAREAPESEATRKLLEGTELTLKQFLQVLERHGVEQVDPLGEKFDPQLHEAVTLQPSEEHEPNSVTMVIQKGYRLHERLVRPAMVVVAQPSNGGGES